MVDNIRQQVLPFYLVCDESYSMQGEGIDAINDSLPDLHAEISTNPSVADKTRFSMIGFSSDAQVLLDLADMSDIEEMPMVEARGATSFAAAFDLLGRKIRTDVAMLKRDGHRVFRPIVFFMTDGNPTDQPGVWEDSLHSLNTSDLHPKMVAFGVGNDVDPRVIRKVGAFRAFISDGTLSPAQALKEFANALTKSIIASGTSADDQGNLTLQVPEKVEGFTSLALDEI